MRCPGNKGSQTSISSEIPVITKHWLLPGMEESKSSGGCLCKHGQIRGYSAGHHLPPSLFPPHFRELRACGSFSPYLLRGLNREDIFPDSGDGDLGKKHSQRVCTVFYRSVGMLLCIHFSQERGRLGSGRGALHKIQQHWNHQFTPHPAQEEGKFEHPLSLGHWSKWGAFGIPSHPCKEENYWEQKTECPYYQPSKHLIQSPAALDSSFVKHN